MSIFSRSVFVAACLGALVHNPALGRAADTPDYPPCTTKPTADDVEGAKGAHKAGAALYGKAKYRLAIQQWRLAYGFDCTAHRLLLNIGNTYEKLGQPRLAVHAFETYVEREGKKADRTIIAKVKNLKELFEKQDDNGLPASAMAPIGDDPPGGGAGGAGAGGAGGTPGDANGPSDGSIAPWLVIGGGALAGIAGGVLIGVGQGKFSDADSICPNQQCPREDATAAQSINDDGVVMNGTGIALMSVGVVAISSGLAWYLLGDSGDDKDNSTGQPEDKASVRIRVAPAVSPAFAGLRLTGRF
jgi:hypothetical protein